MSIIGVWTDELYEGKLDVIFGMVYMMVRMFLLFLLHSFHHGWEAHAIINSATNPNDEDTTILGQILHNLCSQQLLSVVACDLLRISKSDSKKLKI